MEAFGTIISYLQPFTVIYSYFEPFAAIWRHLERMWIFKKNINIKCKNVDKGRGGGGSVVDKNFCMY